MELLPEPVTICLVVLAIESVDARDLAIYNDAALQEAFNTVDKSGDGQIDWGELSAAIKAMDPKASDKVGRALPARARARRAACGPPSSRRARTRGCPRSLRT